MLGILGEDPSDTESLRVIARNISQNSRLMIKTKGYAGCGELLRKAAKQIRAYQQVGLTHFIICHDADGADAEPVRARIIADIVKPSRLLEQCCVLVPVQEFEAWILADEWAIAQAIPTLRVRPISHPEAIAEPKEYLERLSARDRSRPLYRHSVHNEVVARYLRPEVVAQKCPSFRALATFIQTHCAC